jgi:hypothetical protein
MRNECSKWGNGKRCLKEIKGENREWKNVE